MTNHITRKMARATKKNAVSRELPSRLNMAELLMAGVLT